MPERAKEVLSYFVRNPRAADSLEGVVRWRLLDEKIRQGVEETRRALAWLVSQGFLLEESAKGADTLFRLNRDKAVQAGKLLNRAKRGKKHRAD